MAAFVFVFVAIVFSFRWWTLTDRGPFRAGSAIACVRERTYWPYFFFRGSTGSSFLAFCNFLALGFRVAIVSSPSSPRFSAASCRREWAGRPKGASWPRGSWPFGVASSSSSSSLLAFALLPSKSDLAVRPGSQGLALASQGVSLMPIGPTNRSYLGLVGSIPLVILKSLVVSGFFCSIFFPAFSLLPRVAFLVATLFLLSRCFACIRTRN